jgi:branched-chain amino acid transport system ATP-binding protein
MTVLELRGISVSYGRLSAVRDVSLKLKEGETLFITGANGAGKSTLVNAMAGALRPRAGSMLLGGEPLRLGLPERMAQSGIILVPEGRRIFARLTVADNLRVARDARRRPAVIEESSLLELFPVLVQTLNRPAGTLSGGEQQQLAIARALLAAPRVLIIDEPSLGLAPAVVTQVYEVLSELRKRCVMTLVIVEQAAEKASRHADLLAIMRHGQCVFLGRPDEVSDPERLHEIYFGSPEREVGGPHG